MDSSRLTRKGKSYQSEEGKNIGEGEDILRRNRLVEASLLVDDGDNDFIEI
jgi:hypothetical protein